MCVAKRLLLAHFSAHVTKAAPTSPHPKSDGNTHRESLHDLTFPALENMLVGDGLNAIHTRALWKALYRGDGVSRERLQNFSPPLHRWIESRFTDSADIFSDPPEVIADIASSDGLTRKFLLKLADGQSIETVAMGYTGRMTACVSTQAGCAMGCVFCATGQMGFSRHLRPGEIVAQVLHARDAVARRGGHGLRNLVLMGMGEPLHNYDAVLTALEIISDTRGINIGPAKITISTVGVVPGILRLAEEKRGYGLAVSLHGATDGERSALVPAGRRWPLDELIAACRTYCTRTGRRIFFEWTLIAGINDTPTQARRLALLLAGIDAHVNLIPLNPTGGFAGGATSSAAATEFQRVLKAAGIPSTVRQRRGIDVAAGCGQLRTEREKPAA
jgi:23S rRNA (adenine2503-C2)-methyltransferase